MAIFDRPVMTFYRATLC